MLLDIDPNMFADPIYAKMMFDKNRHNLFLGGAGSGKSDFCHFRELVKSFKIKNKILVTRKNFSHHRNSTFSKFKTIAYRYNIDKYFDFGISPMIVVNKLSGCEIFFFGLKDREKLKSVENVQRILNEECSELFWKDYLQILLRVRGQKDVQITSILNPIDENHWTKRELVDKPNKNLTVVKTTYLNNKFLLPEDIETFDNLKTQDEDYYNIYALGNWGTAKKGLVYNNFEVGEDWEVGEYEQSYGLDFGFSNDELALVQLQKIPKFVGKDVLQVKELIFEKKLLTEDLIERMNELQVDKNTPIYCDHRPEIIASLVRAGYNAKPAVKGAGSILEGIQRVAGYKIQVIDSPSIWKECQAYKWKTRSDGTTTDIPVDLFNHTLDAIRYGSSEFVEQNRIKLNLREYGDDEYFLY